MTTQQSNQSSLLEQAAAWHIRLLASDASEADWLAFEQWLLQEPAHRQAYDQIERTWVETESLPNGHSVPGKAAADPALSNTASASAAHRSAGLGPMYRRRSAIAAGLAILAVAAVALSVGSPSSVTYRTEKGETKSVVLADGTKIRLNSGSTLEVTLKEDVRQVVMADAEASFDVAKDARRPFIVSAGDLNVRAVGTEFNILRHDGRLTVTLRSGRLDILPIRALPASASIQLSPGQQLVHDDHRSSDIVRSVDPDNAFAWQNGHLIYHDSPLGDVLSDLNRYFALPLRADTDASALKFSGVLIVDTEKAVVQRLEELLPVRANRSQTEIVLQLKSQR